MIREICASDDKQKSNSRRFWLRWIIHAKINFGSFKFSRSPENSDSCKLAWKLLKPSTTQISKFIHQITQPAEWMRGAEDYLAVVGWSNGASGASNTWTYKFNFPMRYLGCFRGRGEVGGASIKMNLNMLIYFGCSEICLKTNCFILWKFGIYLQPLRVKYFHVT